MYKLPSSNNKVEHFNCEVSNHPLEKYLYENITPKYKTHWRKFAIILDVDDNILNTHNEDDEDCCNALWTKLLKGDVTDLKNDVIKATKLVDVIDQLQQNYINEVDKDVKEIWGAYHSKRMANVMKIHHNDGHVTEEETEYMANLAYKRRLCTVSVKESLVQKYKIVNYISDMFEPKEKQIKILIEGATGIGKTVLSRQIAFEWSSNNLLCNQLFVFLIHLRDPQIPQFTSLLQFVEYAIKISSSDSNLPKLIERYIKRTLGANCTIIFDGYDEISEEAKLEDSFITKIIKGEKLKQCSLVITSRPNASIDLRGYVDRRIEILGFTENDRDEFIRVNLKGEHIVKLQNYLKSNPCISDLCYVPLNMTILLRIFEKYGGQMLQTQTDIYDKFIWITISRFITRETKKEYNINSAYELPESYKQQFRMLCNLAFHLLGKEKVVFNDEDMQNFQLDCNNESATDLNTLGLLKEMHYFTMVEHKPTKSYSFLHLSMQECLAAHHIASSRVAEEKFLKENFWDSRYLNTGVMYVGLTKGQSPAFKNFLYGYSGILNKLFGVEKTTLLDKVKKLHLITCFVEVKNDKLYELLHVDKILDKKTGTIDLSNHVLGQKDIYTLSFFLTKAGNTVWEKLDLTNCFVNVKYLEEFSEISQRKDTNPSIRIIDLSGNDLSQSVNATINLINYFKVKRLVVSDSIVEDVTFRESLLSSITKVRKLEIACNNDTSQIFINCNFYETSDQILSKQVDCKRQFYIWNSNVHISVAILNLIADCNVVNVYEENLTDDVIFDTESKLRKYAERNEMTYVLQSTNNVFAYGAEFYQISQSIKSYEINQQHNTGAIASSSKATLQLTNCEVYLSQPNPLTRILSNSSNNWELIDLSGCNIKDEGCLTLFECFEANKNKLDIKVLNLFSNNLTIQSAVYICRIFQYHTIKTLIISRNEIQIKTFNEVLKSHLLSKKQILNFTNNTPLLVYESTDEHPTCKICNVCAFETSSLNILQLHTYEDRTDSVYIHQEETDLHTSSTIKITGVVKGVIKKFIKIRYNESIRISEPDFSNINITHVSCNVLFHSLFNEEISLSLIEELDLSSHQFSSTCLSTIAGSFQYCAVKKLLLPNNRALDIFNSFILKQCYAGKKIYNFTENIPVTVLIKSNDQKSCTVYNAAVYIYRRNCQVTKELFDELEAACQIYQISSYTLLFFDCSRKNNFKDILTILNNKSFIKICIFETVHLNARLMTSVKDLETYGSRVVYVLAAGTKIVAYNAQPFLIVQAMETQLFICSIEISHCSITKDELQAIGSYLMSKSKVLKEIKIIECKVNDSDFYDFCGKLHYALNYLNTSICLKSIDLSSNILTSSSIYTILKLLECCAIEQFKLSNNLVNSTTLTDAIFELARCEGNKFKNLYLGIPLVIINENIKQVDISLSDVEQFTALFIMNCKIDKTIKCLILEHSTQLKKIFFVNCIVATSHLRRKLKMLHNSITDIVETIFYEKHLKDEVAQKTAAYLKNKAKWDINYILASKTKLLTNRSSYQHVAQLLDCNPLINNLQITNFDIRFSKNGKFIRPLTNTSRKLEMIDLSGSNICDDGCLELIKFFISSNYIIQDINFMCTNLSSASAPAIANIILHCNVKRINIMRTKVQDREVNNALSCLKQNSASAICVELITNNPTFLILSSVYSIPEHLPSNHKVQLSVMYCHQPEYLECFLSSFNKGKLSRLILKNNGLTFEETKKIICNTLPTTDLHIEEPHIHYDFKFVDCSMQHQYSNLLKCDTDPSSFPSLKYLLMEKSNFYMHKINTLNSFEYFLTYSIQTSMRLLQIQLSHCYITNDITRLLANAIEQSITVLKRFELSYIYIRESNLKLITEVLNSTESLISFAFKSIDCISEHAAKDIASIIAKNNSIQYLEISDLKMKSSTIINISKSMKDLLNLKHLNLSNNIVTCEALTFALHNKPFLKNFNFSNCKLQTKEIVHIASALKHQKLTAINLSYNSITNDAATALASLLCTSVSHVEMSNCNLQEEGMSCIINALKHKSLKYLNLSGNRISDLLATDISASIANNPNITDLDLSKCNLQEIGIEEIFTSLKEHTMCLKNLNITPFISNEEMLYLFECVLERNKNIENLTLQGCDCEEIFNVLMEKVSCLQSLDIGSSVISLKTLISIVAKNTNIKHLNLSNCEVQGEHDLADNDLSGLFLEHLNLGRSSITKTFAEFITKLIYNSRKLKHLDIAGCEMQESELINITTSLKAFGNLNYLNCSNNVMNYQTVSNIAEVITKSVYLEQLDISSCSLTEQTFLPIANALKQVKVLKFLNISSNYLNFGPEISSGEYHETTSVANTSISVSVNNITDVITSNCFLECLDISDCKLSDLDILNVATALSELSTLKCLNLSHNKITTDNTAYEIASVITNNLSLKNINLSNCSLQESGITIIAEASAKLTSVISIDLSKNNITDNSAQRVAAALKENCLLENLNISHCFDYSQELSHTSNRNGLNRVLESLTTLTCLTYLNLPSCYINDEASTLLVVVITNNKYLSHLDLAHCKLHTGGIISIAKTLQSTVTLKYLSFNSNVITNEAAHEIALAVSNNFSLQHLALSNCKLEEKGFLDVTKSLHNISSIKYLDLSYNNISDEVSKLLASGITKNMKLTYLDLSFCTWQDRSFTRICEAVSKLSILKEVDLQSH